MTHEVSSSSGSFSSLILVAFMGLCLAAMAGTGYVKYQLDRYETTLAAPDSAFTPDQETYEKTIVALGYSGFLGSAQTYMNNGDRAALADMRMNFKTAQEASMRLADKAPAATRRDIKAILDIFASLIAKADQNDAMSNGLTNADLLTATSALTTLDSRLQTAAATQRKTAQDSIKLWSLALMLMTWSSLIITALLGGSLYYTYKTRQAEPLGKLTQCIDNMLKGSDQTAIWGIERRDAIGDLARMIEKARLAFIQMPDFSIMGEDGPVRVKVDGEQRSLFQSLIKNLTDHLDTTKQSSSSFTNMMGLQQETLLSLTSRLNATLTQLQERGASNGETMQALARTLIDASDNLAQTQEKGVAQIGKLVPALQERIQNMAEVTQLAGTQVAQSLQTLVKAEGTLHASAARSEQVTQQLAGATNQMGERMFAALNLVQASGKLLGDTTQTVKSNFSDAVATLGRGETHLQQIIERAESRLASTINAEENMASLATRTEISAQKMEQAVNAIADRHEGLSEQVVTATHRMESIVSSFDAAQRSMSDATAQVRRDGTLISTLLADLHANNDQLLATVHQNSQMSFSAAQTLAEKSHALMQRLEVQIQQQAQSAETHIEALSVHGQTMAQQATTTTSTLSQTVTALKSEQEKLTATRNHFSDTINDLSTRFEQQATTTFGKTEQWAAQSFTKLTTIAEQVDSVMQRLGMLGQLTGTLGTVAGQLGQLVPTLTQLPLYAGSASSDSAMGGQETKALILQQTEDIMKELQGQWHEAVVQIEAMHDQLAQLVIQQKDQLETRLVVMDKKIREATDEIKSAATSDEAEDRKTEIINELITTMSAINEHVIELDETIEEAGLKKEA
ncbi:MAG: hypothetical protein WC612_03195 [Bdellovibrionales bacterium]|jgi:hypothetical protein